MVRLRVFRAAGEANGSRLRVFGLSGSGEERSTLPTLRVFKASGSGDAVTATRLRVHAVSGSGVTALTVAPLTDMSGVEPESLVSITATMQLGTATSWVWRQVSGPTVSLVGSGATVTFVAPSALTVSTVVLGVVASSSSVSSVERTVSVQVFPQTLWNYSAGSWVGAPASVWL